LDWPAALQASLQCRGSLHVRKEIAEEARKLGVDIQRKRRRDTLHVAHHHRFANGNNREGDAAIVCRRRPFASIPLPGAELAIFPNDIWRLKAMPAA